MRKLVMVAGAKMVNGVGLPEEIITWGGPVATFRWDGANEVDIKNFRVSCDYLKLI
jgi:hypothetical protein